MVGLTTPDMWHAVLFTDERTGTITLVLPAAAVFEQKREKKPMLPLWETEELVEIVPGTTNMMTNALFDHRSVRIPHQADARSILAAVIFIGCCTPSLRLRWKSSLEGKNSGSICCALLVALFTFYSSSPCTLQWRRRQDGRFWRWFDPHRLSHKTILYVLGGSIVIKTHDGHRKPYITLSLNNILGPDYYVPP